MMQSVIQPLLESTWHVLLEASPWLVVGLVAAGLIKAFLPQAWVNRWLGGRGMGAVVRAAVLGTPLPLCSCSVVPASLALRRSGASKGSTVSFLIATPENGADSIALSYAMLGPFMTVVRPVAAVISAVAAGGLTLWFTRNEQAEAGQPTATPQPASCCSNEPEQQPQQPAAASCCSGETKQESVASSCCSSETKQQEQANSCCSTGENTQAAGQGLFAKFRGGMHYAFVDLMGDILPWLAVGVALAIVMMAFIPVGSVAGWAEGPLAMVLMVLIGVPMYICATASTPVAAAMLVAGVSPGTVLVFLLAGPATNLGTLGIVHRELGNRSVLAYLIGVGALVIPLGMLTDWVATTWAFEVRAQAQGAHHVMPHWLAVAGVVVVVALTGYHAYRRFAKHRQQSHTLGAPEPA